MGYLVAKTTIEESTGLVSTTVAGHMALHNDKARAVNSLTEEMMDARNPALATPAETATSVPDLLGQFKQMLKNITGETDWFDSVADTISSIAARFHKDAGHQHTGVTEDAPILSGASLAPTDGLYRTTKYYTSSDTWTKPAGLKFVVVESVGGGGGGGAGNSDGYSGSGGGGGGYCKEKIAVGALGATETVTIGAKGEGSSSGSDNATAGGNSSFGSHHTGNGGGAGVSNGANVTGGAGSGGDLNIQGRNGDWGGIDSKNGGNAGGSSILGFGGSQMTYGGAGRGAVGYGGGGGGGNRNVTTSRAGGAGFAGIIIVYEYF